MSRSSKKIKIANNSNLSKVRSVNERLSKAIYSGQFQSVNQTVLLYKLVFHSKKAILLTLFLCVSFLWQPIDYAYADNESEVVSDVLIEPNPAPEITIDIPDPEPPEVSVPDPVAVAEKLEVIVDETEPELAIDELTPVTVVTDTASTDTESDLSVNPVDVPAEDADFVTSDSATSTEATDVPSDVSELPDSSSGSSSETNPGATTSVSSGVVPNFSDDSSSSFNSSATESDSLATTTVSADEDVDAIDAGSGEFVSYVESDSHFAFTKDQCTRIEDGSYYCQDAESSVELDDSLVAAPDVDGDLEIFLIKKGERHQITHNKVDDASPFYDEYSQTIVWHRLVDDRYQIISFDIGSGEETQLTNSMVNNMEPTRHGEYTVWQRWVENNWEVILYDGKNEKQITDSARHDIAPHVRGPLVIWNSQSNDGTQSLKTYDIQNRTYTTIEDADGVSVANPRMIVMYEAMYENGDIVTKGFDLVSGKIVPLESLPKELPDELPDTDSTGETRALIQHKPETRESDVDDVSDTNPNASTTTPEIPADTLDLSHASTTESQNIEPTNTLDLSQAATSEPMVPEFVESAVPNDIPDLVIEPVEDVLAQATSTQS